MPKMTTEQMREQAELILAQVMKACFFGSTNKGINLEASKYFDKLHKAITNVLLLPQSVCEKRGISFDEKEAIRKRCIVRIYMHDRSSGGYFKHRDTMIYFPPEWVATEEFQKILMMVKKAYPNDKGSKFWEPKYLDHMYAVWSEYNIGWDNFNHNTWLEHFKKHYSEHLNSYIIHYTQSLELKEKMHRKIYFDQSIVEGLKIVYTHGIGNCENLADVAFMDAIARRVDCKITYIRFLNTNDRYVDVINAIALGPWPEKGCIVISPWQKEENRIYEWQGSIKDTPQIRNVNPYDEARVILAVDEDPNSQERQSFQGMLEQAKYSEWLSSADRAASLQKIQTQCEAFKNALLDANFVKENSELQQVKVSTNAPNLYV